MMMYKHLRNFASDQNGGATIENLLWIPIMAFALTFATDATLVMHGQQDMYNAARDTSRQVALGQKNEVEAEEELKARLGGSAYNVDVVIADGFVTSNVTAPFSEFAGLSGALTSGTVSANVSMWIENYESGDSNDT